jgi:thiol-disulfide isomerase/thioredoxin
MSWTPVPLSHRFRIALAGALIAGAASTAAAQTTPLSYSYPSPTGVDFVLWFKRPVRPPLELIPEPVRTRAPDLVLPRWSASGVQGTFDLRSLAGKPVFLDFWAPSCPPCIPLHAHLVREASTWRSQGVEIVSVLSGDAPEVLAAFFAEHGGTPPFPVLVDTTGTVLLGFGSTGLPGMVLLDHHGRIAWRQRLGATQVIDLPDLFPSLLAAAAR